MVASNVKKEITKVLYDKGYIQSDKFEEVGPQGQIKIALKYNPTTKQSAIVELKRVSKPGLRSYVGYQSIPRVFSGLGIAILSTPAGEIEGETARTLKTGGELLY